jgi:hypothetical protein
MVKLPVWGGVSCVMVGTLLSDAWSDIPWDSKNASQI